MAIILLIAQLTYFFLPVAVANMAPVLIGRNFNFLAKPVDFGHTFRGQPLFGAHKTWRGLIVAPIAAELVFLLQYWIATGYDFIRNRPDLTLVAHSWWPFSPPGIFELPLWFGFGFGLAAILGDLLKSFIKRRISINPGATWFPFDQLDFILAAAFFASFFVDFTIVMWILILILAPLLHIAVNRIAYWLHLKEIPW